ncbi:hypothetical protein H101_08097 [Trichophyton interdigitale H6]|nr:hypothetical protein H101_08097 [Trichophyton interdigitale H6]
MLIKSISLIFGCPIPQSDRQRKDIRQEQHQAVLLVLFIMGQPVFCGFFCFSSSPSSSLQAPERAWLRLQTPTSSSSSVSKDSNSERSHVEQLSAKPARPPWQPRPGSRISVLSSRSRAQLR